MKDVYDKLNDMEVSYQKEDLTDIEKKRLATLSQKYAKKNSKMKKIIPLAAALALAFTLASPDVRASVGEFASNIKISIMDTIGSGSDSDKYVTKLDEPIEIDGNSVKIENLVIEEDRIYIDILGASDYIMENSDLPSISKVKINGKTYKALGSSGSTYEIDKEDKLAISSSMISFDEKFPELEDANVDLYFTKVPGFSDVVSLKANVNMAGEEGAFLAKDLELEDADGARLDYMKINPITLSAKILNLDENYDYQLEGLDEYGNQVQLDLRTAEDGVHNFFLNPSFSDINLDQIKDGRQITFQLYRSKINQEGGKLTDGVYEKFGKAFTVNVSE